MGVGARQGKGLMFWEHLPLCNAVKTMPSGPRSAQNGLITSPQKYAAAAIPDYWPRPPKEGKGREPGVGDVSLGRAPTQRHLEVQLSLESVHIRPQSGGRVLWTLVLRRILVDSVA